MPRDERPLCRGRFIGNHIVSYLLVQLKQHALRSPLDNIAEMHQVGVFTDDDYREFYQLIGYSIEGYYELFPEG